MSASEQEWSPAIADHAAQSMHAGLGPWSPAKGSAHRPPSWPTRACPQSRPRLAPGRVETAHGLSGDVAVLRVDPGGCRRREGE